jgi:hypothetical protein
MQVKFLEHSSISKSIFFISTEKDGYAHFLNSLYRKKTGTSLSDRVSVLDSVPNSIGGVIESYLDDDASEFNYFSFYRFYRNLVAMGLTGDVKGRSIIMRSSHVFIRSINPSRHGGSNYYADSSDFVYTYISDRLFVKNVCVCAPTWTVISDCRRRSCHSCGLCLVPSDYNPEQVRANEKRIHHLICGDDCVYYNYNVTQYVRDWECGDYAFHGARIWDFTPFRCPERVCDRFFGRLMPRHRSYRMCTDHLLPALEFEIEHPCIHNIPDVMDQVEHYCFNEGSDSDDLEYYPDDNDRYYSDGHYSDSDYYSLD